MSLQSKERRGVKDLIEIEWNEIDRCLKNLESQKLGDKEKLRWSRLLAKHVERLDKLLWKAGLGKVDEESLAKMLEKVPRKFLHLPLWKGILKNAKRGKRTQT